MQQLDIGQPDTMPSTAQDRPTVADAVVPPPLEARVENSFVGLEPLRAAWDQAAADLGGSVYLSFDWSRTWWEFYGTHKELRIFLFYAGGKLVSAVPLYIDRLGLKPLQFAVARLLGANIPPKSFNPPVHPDWAEAIFEVILTQLLDRDRCDLISLGPACESCGFLKRFESAARRRNPLCARVTLAREGVHTVFHLPGTLDEFFDGMEKDERKKRKYEMRLLTKEPSITRDVVAAPDQVEAEFERFAALHASQWRDKGKLGHFGSWPRGRQYNLALVQALAKLGRVRFVRILAGGEVISSQFAFVFGDFWYWELPARVMDRKWNRFSLGTTGFFGLAEEAIKEGKAHIEGGIAHYDYKRKLGGAEYGLEVLRVVANRFGSQVRTRLYSWLRRCFEIAYYKIWYARISPRLPAPLRKPIWSFWLRLDF
jgi:CelD/BcsL family acetyltransferase involved in cellulose biosynthesis